MLAEDVLLLATDDHTGRSRMHTDLLVAAAVLTELMLAGNVRLTEAGESTRKSRAVVVPDAPWPVDDLLSKALTTLSSKDVWYPQWAVERLAKRLLPAVYERLVRAEQMTRDDATFLGLFPHPRWFKVSPERTDDLRRRLDAVFLFGATPDLQTAALGALLAGSDQLVRLIDRDRGVDRRQVKEVGKQLLAQFWPAEAGKKAREARNAAAAG